MLIPQFNKRNTIGGMRKNFNDDSDSFWRNQTQGIEWRVE